MKKYYCILLLLATNSLLYAQQNDYNPYVPSYTYQYLNASMDTVSSLRVVKASKFGSDSIFTFNSVYYANSGLDSNNIFCQKMVQKPDGEFLFIMKNKDSIKIKTQVELGTQWQLCTSPKTIAKYEGKKTYSFLGMKDTVLEISTDKGFEILISKKFGMVKTIDFRKYLKYGLIKSLYIDAIPEAGLGRFANDPMVIFNYELDDVFVREEKKSDAWTSTYNTRYARYKVVEKKLSSSLDSVTYTFEVDSKSIQRTYADASSGNYSEKVESRFGNRQTIGYRKYSKPVKESVEKESFKLLSQEYREGIFNRYILFDSLTNRYNLSNGILSFNFNFNKIWANYKSDIGLIEEESCRYSEPSMGKCIIAESSKLLCFWKGDEKYNDCNIYDDIIAATESLINNNSLLNIYPNPSSNVLNIGLEEDEMWQRIEIINTLGQVVKKENFAKSLDIQKLPAGMYYLKIYGVNSRLLQTKFFKK